MTDIDQRKLSLHGRLRIAAACPDANASLFAEAADAIEQHEAFRQEVSDAIESLAFTPAAEERLSRFIITITKPDPLVEVLHGMYFSYAPENAQADADALRDALEARGLEIREKGQ